MVILFWLNGIMLFSQNTSIKVTYRIYLDKDEIIEESIKNAREKSYFHELYLSSLEEYKNYTFTLLHKDSVSEFYLSRYLPEPKMSTKSLKKKDFVMGGYTGVVYQLNNRVYKYNPLSNLFAYFPFFSDWELTNEHKEIDGKLCYKANGYNQVVFKEKTFKHSVVAWYCPQLPYNTGPMGYGGLPGMILEIRIRNATFIAEKIEFNTEDEIDVEFFKKHKKIELEELNKRIEEEMQMLKE